MFDVICGKLISENLLAPEARELALRALAAEEMKVWLLSYFTNEQITRQWVYRSKTAAEKEIEGIIEDCEAKGGRVDVQGHDKWRMWTIHLNAATTAWKLEEMRLT